MHPSDVASPQSSAEQQLAKEGHARSGKDTELSQPSSSLPPPPPPPHKLKRDPIAKAKVGGKPPGRSHKATLSKSRRRGAKNDFGTLKGGTSRSSSPGLRRNEWRRTSSPSKETPHISKPSPYRIMQAGTDISRTSAAAVAVTGSAVPPAAIAADAEGFRSGSGRASPASRQSSVGNEPFLEWSARSHTVAASPMADKRSGGTLLVSARPACRLVIIVVIAFAIAVLVVIALLAIIKMAWPRSVPVSGVCSSHACRFYVDRLLSSINKSINPCQDFTRFVCDGWQREHYLDVWEVQFTQILTKLDWYLKSIEWRVSGQNEEQRAAAVYRSCDSVLLGDSDELPTVKAALADAGVVWPQASVGADALGTLLHSSFMLGWDTLLHFVVDDAEELVVSPGRSLHFVFYKHRSGETTVSKEAYFRFLSSSFKPEGATSVAYEDMKAIAEPALNALSAVHLRYIGHRHSADWFVRAPGAGLTEARWLEALGTFNLSLPNGLRLSTTEPEFLQALLSIWEKNGEDTFHLFLSWCTVQVAALYANRPLVMNYYDRHPGKAQVYHKAFCVSRAAFFSRHATFERYNADVLQGNAATVAREITLAVRVAFEHRLSRWALYNENITVVGSWTSLETAFRSFEQQRAHDHGGVQGPDMTDSFVRNWQKSVFVNITGTARSIVESICHLWYYIVIMREPDFQLMPYSLSFPMFDVGLPAAVNYGGLGWEVAGALGTLFLESYNEVNASQVLTECMSTEGDAEYSGFFAAYASGYGALVDAFRRTDRYLSLALPSFGEYTDLQLLFIASCYSMCTGQAKTSQPNCNMMQHVPEFSEAFLCAPGDRMNRSYQCALP